MPTLPLATFHRGASRGATPLDAERALDQLEPLLKTRYYLSPAWLKIKLIQRLLAGGA